MNRKSFLVAAAATVALTLGLGAVPQASAAQPSGTSDPIAARARRGLARTRSLV